MSALIVTGTDTDVGKTVVSAMLTLALGAVYFKPIQCGTEAGTDRKTVQAMTRLDDRHFVPESYVLREPLSPHRAAELEGVEIDAARLSLPDSGGRTLIVEGAGGLMVPITRTLLQIDVFARWHAPVVLCARTRLGTINHTLLSVEALRHRNMHVHGIVFIGEEMADTERTITDIGRVKHLGRLGPLARLDAASLRAAFAANFRAEDWSVFRA